MKVAAGRTLKDLHVALKERLAVVIATLWRFETKTDQRAPEIVDGWLPPKTPEGEQYPFLLVRPQSGTDSEPGADQNAKATVEIVIGTYSDSDDGWLDVLEVIEAVRQDVAAAPSIAGTAFEQTGPLTWEIPAEQVRPQWLGKVVTNWTIPRARRVEARNPEEG